MIHLLQLSVCQHPAWIIVKTDAKNAFNSVSRAAFLDSVAEYFSSLYPFLSKLYLRPPQLAVPMGDNIRCISSTEGVQQGDPFGPFLFHLLCNRVSPRQVPVAKKDLSPAT